MTAKKVIIDTDIGPDCDDAGALGLINKYADQGLCEIIGISHCTSSPYGVPAIDVINRYYGRTDIPLSTYPRPGFLVGDNYERFNRYLAEHYPNRYLHQDSEAAVSMYRRILCEQPDKSVIFIGIGPNNNLSDFIDSKPDEYSPLTGYELIKKKVNCLYLMGGIFRQFSEKEIAKTEKILGCKIEDYVEWNVECDVRAAKNVAENWPSKKVYVGYEAGLFLTGQCLQTEVEKNHPIRMAYKLHSLNPDSDRTERYSWDLVTVECAVNPEGNYAFSENGKVTFDETGHTVWRPSNNGMDCYAELIQSEAENVIRINSVLSAKPVNRL